MFRGLVKEMFSLASWIVALLVANAYGEQLAVMLPDVIPGVMTRLIAGYVILFIATRLLMALLSKALGELIKAGGMSVLDCSLGALFGLGRGIGIVVVVVLLCGTTTLPQQPVWKAAMFSAFAVTAAEAVLPYLPKQFTQHVSF